MAAVESISPGKYKSIHMTGWPGPHLAYLTRVRDPLGQLIADYVGKHSQDIHNMGRQRRISIGFWLQVKRSQSWC